MTDDYYLPGNPTNVSPFPTIYPPPIQGLGRAYLVDKMAPVPVATRLPQPSNTADTVNGFIRLEAAGGAVMLDELLFNCAFIVHSYAPNNQESQAEINCAKALGTCGNAQGQIIIHPSLGISWFVTYSRITSLAIKQSDPQVNLTRFRGMVTWRLQGSLDLQ